MIAIGKIGIWFAHNAMSSAESVAFAQKVEACGYGALWIPEAIGREPFVHLAYLASQTSTLVLATGIANIWARDAVTMAAAQKTLVEISQARAAARAYMKTYVPRLPNYKNNLLELGYTEADFANGCSDRLVDDIVAWGDVAAIKARLQEHYDAGADHVCILPLSTTGRLPNMATVERLAP